MDVRSGWGGACAHENALVRRKTGVGSASFRSPIIYLYCVPKKNREVSYNRPGICLLMNSVCAGAEQPRVHQKDKMPGQL